MKRSVLLVLGAVAVCTWTLAAEPLGSDGYIVPAKPVIPSATLKSAVKPKPAKPADRYGPAVTIPQPDLSKLPRTLKPWDGVDEKAVEIVKRAYVNTCVMERFKSFHIVVRRIDTPPTPEQKARAKEVEAHNRKLGDRSSRRPTALVHQYELAFDDHRVRRSHEPVGSELGSYVLRTWDGKVGCSYSGDPRYNRQEGYSLYSNVEPLMKFSSLDEAGWTPPSWPGQYRYWFHPEPKRDFYEVPPSGPHIPTARLNRDTERNDYRKAFPEEYHLVGTQEYRGTRCYVLEQRPARWSNWRLYVAIDTGLLHGVLCGSALQAGIGPPSSLLGLNDPRVEEIYTAAGYPLKKHAEVVKRWTANPDAGTVAGRMQALKEYDVMQERYYAELNRRGFESEEALANTSGLPYLECWFEDYKEVAPGCFWPMTRGGFNYRLDRQGRLLSGPSTRIEVQKIQVNTKLPDELFTQELKEGVHVNDLRYDPPLRYKYRPGLPDEPMLAAWRAEREKLDATIRQRKAALDSLIGKPAPELPAGKWYNSKPLTWKDLRGKTVIVGFPGPTYTCPSGRDLSLLDALERHKDKTGWQVLAIHAVSSPARHLDLAALDPDQSFPFCQDVPGSNSSNEGATYERFQIATGPYAFVVGPDGKVVRHGLLPDLPEVVAYCEKLPPLKSEMATEAWERCLREGSGRVKAK